MAEIVNLRLARKRKAREESAQAAEQNRVRFGEPRPARGARLVEIKRAEKQLDGHKRAEDGVD